MLKQIPLDGCIDSPERDCTRATAAAAARARVSAPCGSGAARGGRPLARRHARGQRFEAPSSRAGGRRLLGTRLLAPPSIPPRWLSIGSSSARRIQFIQSRCSRGIFPKNLCGPCPAAAMKIEKANAGVLTNFEVLDFLRSRGAKTDPMGCLGAVAASECKVYEYLLKTPACNQTREKIYEFVKRSEGFRLAEADKLNVINWRPSSPADAYAMIEECGRRFCRDERGEACDEEERVQEFLDMVKEVLPPPPPKAEAMEE